MMLLARSLYSIVLLAELTTAWTYNASTGRGPGPSPNAYSAADVSRNDSSSRNFQILYAYGPEPSLARLVQWQWHINTTEIVVNDAEPTMANPRVLNTIYSFSWPDVPEPADSLREKLTQYDYGTTILPERRYVNASSYCVTVVESPFPANTTNAYNASSSLCQLPLRCSTAMTREWLNESGRDEQGCLGVSFDPARLEGCEGVFGAWNATTMNIAAPADDTVRNGTAFYHRTTPAYDGNNSTAYDEERLRLHMIIIDSGTEFDMRCQRIDATPLPNDESVGAAVPGSANAIATNIFLSILLTTALILYLL